jgi:nucleotide-binding universal stress UspA family protein
MPPEFRILAATDGSPPARAALATAIAFPWPEPSRARGVVALGPDAASLSAEKARAQRSLARRWKDVEVRAVHAPPARAILSEARRFGADVIVLGWRGHGAVRRLLAGSVSREVIGRAGRPVLIARTAMSAARRLVVGFDGSRGAQRALRFARGLGRRPGSRIVLSVVVELLPTPSPTRRLPASVRGHLRAEAVTRNRQRALDARQKAAAAVARLKKAGWPVGVDLRFGTPLEALLKTAEARPDSVLIVGASARRGLKAFQRSVSAGALDRSRVPVIIVR